MGEQSGVKPKAEAAISEVKANSKRVIGAASAERNGSARLGTESNDSLYPELSERHDPRLITLDELGEYLKRGRTWLHGSRT